MNTHSLRLSYLDQLEAESIYIMREVVAQSNNPVMLYSIGKDSSVMLHLAMKAFYPSKLPFPILHVDTTWKFHEMIDFRDRIVRDLGLNLIVYTNQDGINDGITPFTHDSTVYTNIMKTVALKQALDKFKFDIAIGGARRDEEKSRAKERVFSFRNHQHHWDPKNQRPEIWSLYNARICKGESIRAFPLSNWTEVDIWQYIYRENIPIVPLYLAKPRAVVEKDGVQILVDDDRLPLHDYSAPVVKSVRFRTLGCYPLTSAFESNASSIEDIIKETIQTKKSERYGRLIDFDQSSSMEKKKIEGYF
ncbi:sulfate adenylyltransferase subunit CysD [Myxococcota bacterium]|nr:sulfate adenylyltransferase subunit CysD [Myxococcota bacterium]MBU1897282.1 sulfate adenylyltransferase subunit CysD [Myxococcota bacterium]